MRQVFTFCQAIFFLVLTTNAINAQGGLIPADKPATLVELDIPDMRSWLSNAPMEDTEAAQKSVIIIELPLPDGAGTIDVKAVESPILKGKVAQRFKEIKSYIVHGIDDPTVYGRITVSPFGLHAYVTSATGGDFYVEPNGQGVMDISEHKVYYRKDGDKFVHGEPDDLFYDGYHDHSDGNYHTHDDLSKFMTTKIGNLTRTEYEVVFVADDTYYDFHRGGNTIGSTAADMAVTAAITAMTDGINVIYERDLAMRLVSASVGPILFRSNPTLAGQADPLFSATGSRGNATASLTVFDEIVTNNTVFDADDNTIVDAAIVAATNLTSNAGISINDFDIGHLIAGQGGGGSAFVGISCRDAGLNGHDPGKAGGGSAVSSPVGNGWIELVAHEFGHQFGAPHSWNGGTERCGDSPDGSTTIAGFCDAFGQYSPGNGYEPGGGITLMSYAGICSQHNLVEYNTTSTASEIPFIHARSIQTIRAHIDGVSCNATVTTTNNAPDITLPNCTNNIPRGTPFELTASATDADGNSLTYSWEQIDLGAQGAPGIGGGTSAAAAGVGEEDFGCDFTRDPNTGQTTSGTENSTVIVSSAQNTGAPTFRSYDATTSPTRSFPRVEKVVDRRGDLSNTADRDGEVLPNYARTLTFRFTARDNNGGLSYDDLTITMDASGPFEVTAPTAGTIVNAGNPTTVNWNANGFTGCTNVNIKLSTDGGLTFPITLGQAAFSANTATVNLPSSGLGTTNARIRVECADNDCATFYNVSEAFELSNPSCQAGESNLTDANPQTFDAPPADLGWSNTGNRFFSSIETSVTADLATGASGDSPATTTVGGTACESPNFNYAHVSFDFQVDQDGTYNFQRPASTTNISIFSDFTGYNGGNSCSSGTFLGANFANNGSNYSVFGATNVNLVTGVTYTMLIGGSSGTRTVTFAGPGNVLFPGTDPGANYSYTYVLVSDADGLIKGVSPTADFGEDASYVIGTYEVVGISYLTTDAPDPTMWIGQSIGALTGTTCLRRSTNSKTLTFTSPLPVELLAFKGEAMPDYNQLQWVTATEINNSGFEVQRSTDGKTWKMLDFVAGNGTTLERQQYRYFDAQPIEGISYYRLKQIDTDETFEYSDIISVERKLEVVKDLLVYPNPTSETITFELGGTALGKYTFQLLDPLGRVVASWSDLDGTVHVVSVAHLSNGFYTLAAQGNNTFFVKRFVKQ